MPTYDRLCIDSKCSTEIIDCFEPITPPDVTCPKCGKPTERAWIGKPAAVVQDSIEGGIWIRHGLCNEDGSPRKYYSKSEIAAEAKRRGLINVVRHVGEQGSDKSKHTTAWTAIPIDEAERLRAWYEHESKTQQKHS